MLWPSGIGQLQLILFIQFSQNTYVWTSYLDQSDANT